MRLIDADVLVEWIDAGHLRNPHELCFSESDVVDMIDHMPTIEQPHWIPCKERPPEENGWYIISAQGETWVAIYTNGRWGSPSLLSLFLEGVTAWMPLPEPFKEVEE